MIQEIFIIWNQAYLSWSLDQLEILHWEYEISLVIYQLPKGVYAHITHVLGLSFTAILPLDRGRPKAFWRSFTLVTTVHNPLVYMHMLSGLSPPSRRIGSFTKGIKRTGGKLAFYEYRLSGFLILFYCFCEYLFKS